MQLTMPEQERHFLTDLADFCVKQAQKILPQQNEAVPRKLVLRQLIHEPENRFQ
ncbi:hypothetical protein [Photorhabdus heterorhabditis]|uniref:hypothetical protein n=1 Tax=Photorhabdus heterorhabditis TaxID=880156 RepID=UPI00165FFCB2|nr:hypothetical protein [Photorhabdus heterorhabditis]